MLYQSNCHKFLFFHHTQMMYFLKVAMQLLWWKWLARNKRLVNQLEERLLVSSLLQRQLVNPLRLPVVSRSLIVSDLEQLRLERSGSIRSQLSFWFANCHSRDLFVKSPKISRRTWDFSRQLWWLFKKLQKRILLASLRTLTCALFTLRG